MSVSLGANIKAPACTINWIRAIINWNTHSSTCVINPNTNGICGFNGKLPPGTNYNNISIIHNNGTCTISNWWNVHVISENWWLWWEEPPHYNGYYRNCKCNS